VVVVVPVVVVSVVVVSVEVVVVSCHVLVKINGGQGVSPPGMSPVGKGDVWYSTSGAVVVAVTVKTGLRMFWIGS
jgi:streptogramin lyase